MTLLDKVLTNNEKFVKPGAFPPLPKDPKRQLAIFTCMDTRLVDFLEPAMGIKRGDAKVIKNAGNTLVDPNGGVIRSLVAAIFLLGVEEIFVIGHKDCGMSSVDAEKLKEKMIARGVDPSAIDSLVPDLGQWMGAFACPEENVERVTQIIRNSPLIPKDVPVHGLIFCPNDGHLEVIVRGY
ncbi:carbonic anhydrase, beta-family, clade D [Citrifermentans bemidjiense Bem]|uniref:Carbonic anhydrase, beta-family, clade D n=1 Tax=Citrifermentans bemidjiense (strain ATCC BAA-1014 / DSM 16622 / JCM 12645 / Bem) TaxID=404380 RepID=B5EB40_CITBB|nr:carbonic anhydrase [Citrifermentans bemidjiense]ACH38901.1 carbonic anhydrase, beta-family, clade D [Citrifermentans bemidjiense Bem]